MLLPRKQHRLIPVFSILGQLAILVSPARVPVPAAVLLPAGSPRRSFGVCQRNAPERTPKNSVANTRHAPRRFCAWAKGGGTCASAGHATTGLPGVIANPRAAQVGTSQPSRRDRRIHRIPTGCVSTPALNVRASVLSSSSRMQAPAGAASVQAQGDQLLTPGAGTEPRNGERSSRQRRRRGPCAAPACRTAASPPDCESNAPAAPPAPGVWPTPRAIR